MFSHIYVEKKIATHHVTKKILAHFPNSTIVSMDNHKQFFNRPNQNFMAQRQSLKLVLAKQEQNFLHTGTDRVRSFGEPHIISSSMIRNCLYHCEYCFLAGMHESANILIYVNIEDFATALEKVAKELAPEQIYFISSYLTDMPILEKIFPISEYWINITKKIPNLEMEIRTKGDAYQHLQKIGSQKHVVLTWSCSPQEVVRKYEHGTASQHTRILQASQAIADGWRVRLCFDPILYYEGWEQNYRTCLQQCFARCKPAQVEKISYGVFRMGVSYLQRMRHHRTGAKILHAHIAQKDGLGTYSDETIAHIREKFSAMLLEYVPEDKIHFVHG